MSASAILRGLDNAGILGIVSTMPIEREEWLILLGMVADIRAELTALTDALADDDGDEDPEDA